MATWESLFAQGARRELRVTFSSDFFLKTYGQDKITGGRITSDLFAGGRMSVGGTVAAVCEISIIDPLTNGAENIPRACPFTVEIRLAEGNDASAWYPLGTFSVDTRERSETMPEVLSITGYDAMLRGETPYYPYGSEITGWPKTDIDAVRDIADRLGVKVGADVGYIMIRRYAIPSPDAGEGGFTVREVLGYIGAMYGGNWFIDAYGYLRLALVGDEPAPGVDVLVDENGDVIKIGGVRIIV